MAVAAVGPAFQVQLDQAVDAAVQRGRILPRVKPCRRQHLEFAAKPPDHVAAVTAQACQIIIPAVGQGDERNAGRYRFTPPGIRRADVLAQGPGKRRFRDEIRQQQLVVRQRFVQDRLNQDIGNLVGLRRIDQRIQIIRRRITTGADVAQYLHRHQPQHPPVLQIERHDPDHDAGIAHHQQAQLLAIAVMFPPEMLPLPGHEDTGIGYAILQSCPRLTHGFEACAVGDDFNLHGVCGLLAKLLGLRV